MSRDKAESDPDFPVDPAPKKIPAWARPPILMYATMVAAFAVVGFFVIYYVMRQG